LLSATGLVQAQDGELGVTLDVTYVSKYIWRGIDLLDDVGAVQPSIDIDLFGTGFSFNVWSSYAGSGGMANHGAFSRVDATEYDYKLIYETTLLEDERLATNIMANWIYYDFIDAPSVGSAQGGGDAQELGVGFSWPNLCPMGIVPSYYVGKIWEARSNSVLTGEYGGWVHVFGLGYDLELPPILPETTEQIVNLSVNLVYNDGFAGATVDHDWSHIVWGASTSVDIGPGTLSPGLYYQTSMEDSVNPEDELWTGISYTINF